ncbi:MAG: hypothetical protein LBT36_00600, partial [Oscillospiraceae bacterium]|nr:hypothetical protein [Oscillospiraceae bacterium]
MRIETAVTRSAERAAGAQFVADALEVSEGDTLRVKVLSVGGASVTLKTEDGRLFHARLEGDVTFAEGDSAL